MQNVHDRVSMLGQYSHRAHRAGHAAGRGSGKPPAGTGRRDAVNVLPGLPHRLKWSTLILWPSHHQGLRLILLLTPNNGISQKETCPDLHQEKPLRCMCTAFWVGRCCPSPWGARERWEGPHGGTTAPLVRDCTTFQELRSSSSRNCVTQCFSVVVQMQSQLQGPKSSSTGLACARHHVQ